MYDHAKQMRCDFIRGKSQREMDDMLPLYSDVISFICPCSEEVFAQNFDAELSKQLASASPKTLANHRTEIAGSLLGLYYEDEGRVFESERSMKFRNDGDQPALFKDVCFKHQFPTGVQKMATVQIKAVAGINFKPYPFILKILRMAEVSHLVLTVNDIGYYILNSADVLRGNATPDEVFDVIEEDRSKGIVRHIPSNGRAASYVFQHIREQLNYLELANLILISHGGEISLNKYETTAIEVFIDEYDTPLLFDFTSYDLESAEGRQIAHSEWRKYYGKLSQPAVLGAFATKASAILSAPTASNESDSASTSSTQEEEGQDETTVARGDEGEDIVFNFEKSRVKAYSPRLANRVLSLGKIKGLGYDVQSVVAEPGPEAEFSKYIEVKTTKRVTAPALDDASWNQVFTMTRNEYLAASQHKSLYYIFRVYVTRDGIVFHTMNDIIQKCNEGKMEIFPTEYRVIITNKSVDKVITAEEVEEQINA